VRARRCCVCSCTQAWFADCVYCVYCAPEYTDAAIFVPKNTRVMVRKINVKTQSSALKDVPEKAAMYALICSAACWF